MLASSPAVAYIHEPFHVRPEPTVCTARFDRWFTYVCAENEEGVAPHFQEMLDRIGRAGRPLLKDPIAVFSAEWLASRFDTANLVMIRHPAAFAGSLKEKQWNHPFADFLAQPLLMRDHLAPFAGEIMRLARVEADVVDQAALLWNVIHHVVLKYRAEHPDWVFVRHDDLSRDPMAGFRSLFERLGLEFTSESKATVMEHSRSGPGALQRDSHANVDSWRERLTAGEVSRLRSRVGEISAHFYSEEEW